MASIRTFREREVCWGAPCTRLETEVDATEEEIADLLVEAILEDGLIEVVTYKYDKEADRITDKSAWVTTIDDFTEEQIDIDASEFVDLDLLVDLVREMEETPDTLEPTELEIYAMIGVLPPQIRNKKYNDELEEALDIERIKYEGVKNVTSK